MFGAEFSGNDRVTEDGFVITEGARRIDVMEWCATRLSRKLRAQGLLLLPVVVEALTMAASRNGSLRKLDIRAFYDEYVTKALELSSDDPPLVCDAFTALTLHAAFAWLQAQGFLARRVNAGSYDYWLAAPVQEARTGALPDTHRPDACLAALRGAV